MESGVNICETLNADLNTTLLIATLILGITVGMALERPEPCDEVNVFETCENNDVAVEVHRAAAMACSIFCIMTMLISGQLLTDLGRVPAEQSKRYLLNVLDIMGAKTIAYEGAIWAFSVTMVVQLLVTLRPPSAYGCLALLSLGVVVTLYAKRQSSRSADEALFAKDGYRDVALQPHQEGRS